MIVLVASFLCWLLLAHTACAGQVNIFIYHRFDEGRYPSTNISSEVFQRQLEYLQQHNYQVVSLGEVVRRIVAGEPLPEKGAALCADDAYLSFADVAMPIVRQYGYPITLFVNTDALGARGYLSWEQVKALAAEGVEIGNHTASHPYLTEMEAGEDLAAWRLRVTADINKAQHGFEQHLGYAPEMIAYTFGGSCEQFVSVVKELGFKAAFAQQSGVVHERHDLFNLPRFPMGGPYATLQGFVDKLKMKPLIVLQQEPFSPVVVETNLP